MPRFVCVKQVDLKDCGPAALATVALHYGMRIGREKMRDVAGTDRIGTNLLGMLQAAEKLGFSARAVKGPYEGLADVALPAIAHVKTETGLGHFVVVYRASDRRVVVADPARGVEKLSRDEFCARWTGYLLLLAPAEDFGKAAGEHGVDRPLRRFMSLMLRHKRFLFEGFACAILMTILGISTSYFIQHLVDSVLTRGEGGLLNALGLGMLVIVLFKTLFGALRQYLMAHIGRKVGLSLISGYARHVLRLPMRFFEMRQVGEILSRVQDAGKVRSAISGVTLTVLVDGTLVVLSACVLWMYDAQLALVATLFIPAMALSAVAHHPAARRRSREAMEQAAKLSAHLVEDVSGVETVKGLGLEDIRSEEADDKLCDVVDSGFSLQKLGVSAQSLAMFSMGTAGIVVLWFGGHRVMSGALSIGQLMFFHSLLGYMLSPLERLSSVNLQIQDALVAVDRLYQILDLEQEQDECKGTAKLEKLERGIELKGVNFQYGTRAPVLHGVDLHIPAGKTVAIIGESGSGKTTLLKLLQRFYDPSEGQVLIDGIDLRDFDLRSVRQRVGVVSQEPFIFNGTVMENIIAARPEASQEEVIAAIKSAGLEQVIARLPERFNTVIGERGANLSGGQRQRLAIARALLKSPDILIFDEATSHLDTATERAIQNSLEAELADRTVIMVAHRLSTVRNADIIYVMDDGKVVESGDHRELLLLGGRYAWLWRSQAGDDVQAA